MKLGMQLGFGPGHIVLDGDPAPLPKGQRGTAPNVGPYLLWPNGWIKIPFSREVGLDPSDIVLGRTQLFLPKKGTEPPIFGPCILWKTARWIKMPLGTEVGLDPGHIVLDGDPALPPQKGSTAPNFRPMSIMAKRLDGSRCHLIWR